MSKIKIAGILCHKFKKRPCRSLITPAWPLFILYRAILVMLIVRYARKVKSGFIVSTVLSFSPLYGYSSK